MATSILFTSRVAAKANTSNCKIGGTNTTMRLRGSRSTLSTSLMNWARRRVNENLVANMASLQILARGTFSNHEEQHADHRHGRQVGKEYRPDVPSQEYGFQ